MTNFSHKGNMMTVTAPADVTAHDFVVVGTICGFAAYSALSGASLELETEGCFDNVPKATGTAWVAGQPLFWDSSAKKFTADETKQQLEVQAVAAAASGDTTGSVKLEGGMKSHSFEYTTVAAADTIAIPGFSYIYAAQATLSSDPVDDPEWVSITRGDQNGAPAAGSVIVKTWKNTSGSDPTPAAATTFSKKVNITVWGY